MLWTLNFDNSLLQVHYYRSIWPCKWPWNDLVTEETHESRNEGRSEGKNEAINEAGNDTVNYQWIPPVAWFHHCIASWRNNCRIKCQYKCRRKDIVSIWSLMIVFLLSRENENDSKKEHTNLHGWKNPHLRWSRWGFNLRSDIEVYLDVLELIHSAAGGEGVEVLFRVLNRDC